MDEGRVVLEIPREKGVRVVVIEDGRVVENAKLQPYHRFTVITQDGRLLDAEHTTRKRYRKSAGSPD